MSDRIVLPDDPRFKNLTGKQFGKLLVVAYAGRMPETDGRFKNYWLCRCICGVEIKVRTTYLTSGGQKGCRKCSAATHHLTTTPTYKIWIGMRHRCRNPNHSSYKDYGGRGISVCERWESFENFLADMGERPSKTHSIERVNNDGNYCPENCVWGTPSQQARNQSTRTKYEFKGKAMLLSDWSKELGISRTRLSNRLADGWSIERAFTTPVNTKLGRLGRKRRPKPLAAGARAPKRKPGYLF